jgi:branched-chain amino acid transport system permease protein
MEGPGLSAVGTLLPRARAGFQWSALRSRADLGLLLVLLASTLFLPRRAGGLYTLGTVTGAMYALNAAGLILIYRSNRVINFAQVAVGSVGALLFAALVTYNWPTRKIQELCGCWEVPPPWWFRAEFWLSAVVGVLAAVALSYILYAFVVRFLASAPRLVVALATLFFVRVCDWLTTIISDNRFASEEQVRAQIPIQGPRVPVRPGRWQHKFGIVTLHPSDFLVLIATLVLVVALGWYLMRSSAGIAIRGAADNSSRVASLGVNVLSVTGRVWILAGVLSGVAGVLAAMGGSVVKPGVGIDVELLVRILAIVIFARFASVPLAGVAAVVMGILQQTVQFAYNTTVMLDGLLLLIIGVAMLVQRVQRVRADADVESGFKTAREIRPIPRELKVLPEVRKWLRTLSFVGVVVLLGSPALLRPSQINLASYCVIVTMIFLSVLVLTGWAGQISLGQMAFAGIGGWVAAVSGLPFFLALIAGAMGGAALALVIGIPGLRLRGLYLAIITLALSLSTTAYLLNARYLGSKLPDSIRRPVLFGMDLDNEQVFYYAALVMLGLVTAMVAGLRRSAFARALIAARDNESAAQAFGINLLRARLSAFAVSGAIAGFAGGLLAFHQHSVIPETFSAGESLTVFLFSTLGGLGAVSAPLIAGVVFTAAKLFMPSNIFQFATGTAGIALLLFASGGVSELVFGIRDAYLRSVARRRKIVVASLLADERDLGAIRSRLPIKPNQVGRSGATVLIPVRYRLDDQYAIRPPVDHPAEVR